MVSGIITEENIGILEDCAELSRMIYQKEHAFQGWGKHVSRFDDAEAHKHGDFQIGLCVDKEKEQVYIFCKGTDPKSYQEIWTDVKFRKIENPNGDGEIHRGFHGALNKTEDNPFSDQHRETFFKRILQYLEKYPDYQINICGHSLGGAMATETVRRLKKEEILGKNGPTRRITFGEPRSANKAAALELEQCEDLESFRFVNGADPITRVPKINYYHTGRPIRLENGQINYGDRETEGASRRELSSRERAMPFLRSLVGVMPFLKRVVNLPRSLPDHNMDSYVDMVERMAEIIGRSASSSQERSGEEFIAHSPERPGVQRRSWSARVGGGGRGEGQNMPRPGALVHAERSSRNPFSSMIR